MGKGAGSGYETLWGCCGKTVDRWYYEATHASDRSARTSAPASSHCAHVCAATTRSAPPHASDDDAPSHISVSTSSHPGSSDDIEGEHACCPRVPSPPPRNRAQSVSAASTASTRVKRTKKPRSTTPKDETGQHTLRTSPDPAHTCCIFHLHLAITEMSMQTQVRFKHSLHMTTHYSRPRMLRSLLWCKLCASPPHAPRTRQVQVRTCCRVRGSAFGHARLRRGRNPRSGRM
ncbi:hypothetical protein DFH09DRAFT_480570 [Mycena vulgaris]|nr:hypothetical protein DFH09DRAFT_480570 [Mycena vulgaris]